jgi:hypothetical protein
MFTQPISPPLIYPGISRSCRNLHPASLFHKNQPPHHPASRATQHGAYPIHQILIIVQPLSPQISINQRWSKDSHRVQGGPGPRSNSENSQRVTQSNQQPIQLIPRFRFVNSQQVYREHQKPSCNEFHHGIREEIEIFPRIQMWVAQAVWQH